MPPKNSYFGMLLRFPKLKRRQQITNNRVKFFFSTIRFKINLSLKVELFFN